MVYLGKRPRAADLDHAGWELATRINALPPAALHDALGAALAREEDPGRRQARERVQALVAALCPSNGHPRSLRTGPTIAPASSIGPPDAA